MSTFRTALMAGLCAQIAGAAVIANLSTDFSLTSNPTSSGWAFRAGAGLANSSEGLAGWGLPGETGWRSTFPLVYFQAAANPDPGYDWLAGDIITHTPEDTTIESAYEWTSNYTGAVDILATVWNGRNIDRGTAFALKINGATQVSGSIQSGDGHTRNNAFPFGVIAFSLLTGDIVRLELRKLNAPGLTFFGDFVGTNLSISTRDQAVVPEPGSAALTLLAAAVLAVAKIRTSR